MDIKLIMTGDGRTAELPCGSVTLKSKRLAAAGTMEVFTPDKSVPLRCGMEARLSVEGTDVFAGYLFTVGAERGGRTLVAADSMRYLLCKDTKAYVNLSAAEIVRDICGERGLTLGTAEDGGVKLEELTCDQQTLLDIISTAIDESEKMGGGRLTLFDDAGVLRLMREENLRTGLTLTGENCLSGYLATEEIGQDTYNRIQLVRKNRKTGRREFFVKEDAGSIERWGVLQYSENVLQNTPDGEIEARLTSLLQQKNRAVKGLTLQGAGDIRCRAGFIVDVEIPEAGVGGEYRILTAEHRFRSGGYTMKLGCEAVEG